MSPAKPLPLDAEEYLVWLAVERGRATNTVAAYRRDLNAYCAYLDAQKRPLDAVSEADIERYVERQRAAGKAATSIARCSSRCGLSIGSWPRRAASNTTRPRTWRRRRCHKAFRAR